MTAAPKGRNRTFIRSIQVCDAELASDPNNAVLLGRRGEAKRKLGLNESAIVDFDCALSVKPSSALVLAARGSAKRALGQHAEALMDFELALQLEPKNAQLLISRSSAYRLLGKITEALSDLDAALLSEPHNAHALQTRGELRRKQGSYEAALADFNACLRINPANAAAFAGRGAAKRSLGKQAECIADYDKALRLDPRNAAVLAGRGGAKLELGKYEDALSDFDKALALNPNDAYSKWGRAMALKQDGMAPLQTITLSGFARAEFNSKYVERRHLEFTVNDCETYWSESGEYFVYWCQKETRWKGSRSSDLPEVQGGRNCGLIGSPLGADILSPSFSGGWYEWDGKAWEQRPKAGISTIGLLTTVSKTLRLTGFAKAELNVEYIERRQPEFTVCGRETYWSNGGAHFLYFSKKEGRWKCARSGDLLPIQGGKHSGYLGSRNGADLHDPKLHKGWHEWDGTAWVFRPQAGVAVATQKTAAAAHAAPQKGAAAAAPAPQKGAAAAAPRAAAGAQDGRSPKKARLS